MLTMKSSDISSEIPSLGSARTTHVSWVEFGGKLRCVRNTASDASPRCGCSREISAKFVGIAGTVLKVAKCFAI